jgi:hypothetical protein
MKGLTTKENYQLRVRSGNIALDRIIYNTAYPAFSKYLPLNKDNSVTGYIDIRFRNDHHRGLQKSATGYKTNVIYGNSWYTGYEYRGLSADTEIVAGGITSWQDSTMSTTILDIAGKGLWSADFRYRGNTDRSGKLVDTADKSARLCLRRIVQQFEEDFVAGKRRQKKRPKIALIVKELRFGGSVENAQDHNE